MNGNMPKINCKQGFTLIELLVVVLIIGILAAIAVPQYQMAVAKSRLATLKNITEAVAQAQEIYYLANGKYTDKLSELDVEFPGGGEINEEGNKITYDWGNCRTSITDANCRYVQRSEQILYHVLFSHISYSRAGQRACMVVRAESETSFGNKLCQHDTGKNISQDFQPAYEAYSYYY